MKESYVNIIPNSIMIVWCLIIYKVLTNSNGVEYVILYITLLITCVNLIKNGINKSNLKIILPFIMLLAIQIIGLVNNITMVSVRNITSSICICGFILYSIFYMPSIRYKFMTTLYFVMLIILLCYDLLNLNFASYSGNTSSGQIMFISMIYLFMFLSHHNQNQINSKFTNIPMKKDYSSFKNFIIVTINLSITILLISFLNARSAIITGVISWVTFLLLLLIKPSYKQLKIFFWVLVIMIVIGIVFYINIKSFRWYEELNFYSIKYFGKNIDSSRPYIWKTSLQQVEKSILLGIGTGTLPSIDRYSNSSFHNTYIQLFVQNGLIGLSCLILILYRLWDALIVSSKDIAVKLSIAAFIGIIVYNCFEVTLISNKISLGIIQWLLICLGVSRSVKISRTYKHGGVKNG